MAYRPGAEDETRRPPSDLAKAFREEQTTPGWDQTRAPVSWSAKGGGSRQRARAVTTMGKGSDNLSRHSTPYSGPISKLLTNTYQICS